MIITPCQTHPPKKHPSCMLVLYSLLVCQVIICISIPMDRPFNSPICDEIMLTSFNLLFIYVMISQLYFPAMILYLVKTIQLMIYRT